MGVCTVIARHRRHGSHGTITKHKSHNGSRRAIASIVMVATHRIPIRVTRPCKREFGQRLI